MSLTMDAQTHNYRRSRARWLIKNSLAVFDGTIGKFPKEFPPDKAADAVRADEVSTPVRRYRFFWNLSTLVLPEALPAYGAI